jgi:hypothetical protein
MTKWIDVLAGGGCSQGGHDGLARQDQDQRAAAGAVGEAVKSEEPNWRKIIQDANIKVE